MTERLTDQGLLRLLTWLSPSFPVGAYTYSHGIEYSVECGLIADEVSLRDWIATLLLHGGGQVDAALFVHAHRAVCVGEGESLGHLFELAGALRGTSEMALESQAQGEAFLKMICQVWPHPQLEHWQKALKEEKQKPAYPVVVALAAALDSVPLQAALTGFLHATAANLVSAGVRLVPLGQTAGQEATAGLEETVFTATRWAMETSIEDIGTAVPMVDWTSMAHETQYTRLFRS